jgi:hypothetical protein
MNIFPKDLQYFITELFFENKKEIILLYTDSKYSNRDLRGYYRPKKIIQEFKSTIILFNEAAECGNIRLMKFLYENKCPWNSNIFSGVAKHGNLENMQWDTWTFYYAARHGNLENMQWILDNGCPWDAWTFSHATYNGNLEILKWLFEKRAPWESATFSHAAYHGNLENMQWLFEKGCPWEPDTFALAASHGNLENMQWLLDNGCPWRSYTFENLEKEKTKEFLKINGMI